LGIERDRVFFDRIGKGTRSGIFRWDGEGNAIAYFSMGWGIERDRVFLDWMGNRTRSGIFRWDGE
jgi:hypothetical protein